MSIIPLEEFCVKCIIILSTAPIRWLLSHWIGLEVEATGPSLVVIAQAYYNSWHAYVDGQRVPLWRANHAFQAVEVPSGRHEIQLRYEDWGFYAGAILSGSTLAGCGMGLGLSRRRSHRLKCL